jgi:hypothetical protein
LIVDYGLPGNSIGRWLVYRLIRLYEGPYYDGFVRANLRARLEAMGVAVTVELPALLGAVRIWKGRKSQGAKSSSGGTS